MSDSPLISRRAFLATGAVVLTGAALPPAFLANDTTNELEVAERRLVLPTLAPALEGFRIAQLSDVHLYEGVHPTARQALDILERQRPDLIVITGDMWDTPRGNAITTEWLQSLPRGVTSVAILGNHDYNHLPTGIKPATAYDRAHVPLLRNESLVIERGGVKLAVVGLDDLRHGRPDPVRAARDVPPDAAQCWLVHEPGMYDRLNWPDRTTPRFILSGHTHGGQVRLPMLPAYLPRGSGRYVSGAYEVAGAPAYVSRGVGTSGPRLRVACPAELPIFTLTRAGSRLG